MGFDGSQIKRLLYWRFEPTYVTAAGSSATVVDLSGRGQSMNVEGHQGFISDTSAAAVVQGTPTINPEYPCGQVYKNIWHFVAPAQFTGDLSAAYGGRLQFEMFSPSHTGRARNRRGSVVLFGSSTEISCPVQIFELPCSTGWTSYSVVIREDFGWVNEPGNTALSSLELKEVLRNV